MQYLPLFFRLRDKAVLLVGGGHVALRKARQLARAGAAVTAVAPEFSDEFAAYAEEHDISCERRLFDARDPARAWLVVAATDNSDANAAVANACSAACTWVNVVDDQAASTAIFPSIIDRSPLVVAISSGGASPTLARIVRSWIDPLLPQGIGNLADFAHARRDEVASALPTFEKRQRFWQRLLDRLAGQAGDPSATADWQQQFDALLSSAAKVATPSGTLALVGAGPGDPELLTVKGLRLLQRAEVVLYDNLANPALLDYARRDAVLLNVGKQRGSTGTSQDAINALILEHARLGRSVVRLKGGDPFVFGRGGEELELALAAGIECIAVPGVTAALGAASYAGIPLTHRDLSQSIRFVTGHRMTNEPNLDWPELAKPGQTLVIYMGLANLDGILARLQDHGMAALAPAALVENATLPTQRVLRATVNELSERVREAAIDGPSVVIVGDVVARGWRD